ncbi:MAG: hypothetical protein ACQET8_17420 [Bacillota bacterium]|jgi:hypothetical protein
MWRLVFGEDTNLTYSEVSIMDVHELGEANAAYDLYLAAKRKALKKK